MAINKPGTYLITFADGTKIITGNNYKPWWQHATEYIYKYMGDREQITEHGWRYHFVEGVVIDVEYSNQQFYDDGGLKWCQYYEYQSLINDVCRQQDLAPVKASAVKFKPSPADKSTLTKKLKEY